MKTKQKLWIVGVVFLIAVIVLLLLDIRTIGGGNSYALTACSHYLLIAQISAEENNSQFEISKLEMSNQTDFAKLTQNGLLYGADFLVKTNFTWGNGQRQIVIVCDREFGNVPRPTIWNFYHQNPAYAVGYSDGSRGLISPEQFTNLNLSGFVSVTNLTAKISKP